MSKGGSIESECDDLVDIFSKELWFRILPCIPLWIPLWRPRDLGRPLDELLFPLGRPRPLVEPLEYNDVPDMASLFRLLERLDDELSGGEPKLKPQVIN